MSLTNCAREKFLATTKPFDLADASELKKLLETSHVRRLDTQEHLYSRGISAGHLNIVVSGMVRIGVLSQDGAEVVFHFVGPGRLVGALDAIMQGESTANAVAIEPSVVLSINAEAVRRFASTNAAAAMSLLSIIGGFAAEIQRQFEDTAFLDLRTRAARRLMDFVIPGASASVIRISQQDLASSICATRERLNRILSEWRSQGIVECLRGRIIVQNIEALRAIADPTAARRTP